MADDDVKDDKPVEKKEPPMADVDWRTAAKNAGYALVPEGDLSGLKAAQDQLKNLRAVFPEDARGKEGDYITTLQGSAKRVSELETEVKSVETLKKENGELKEQNEGLTKGKKLSDMWGHVSRIQQVRNVRVHDRFIDEQKLVDFPLGDHDLKDEKGVKKFAESLWKDVLEPAHKEQTTVIEQVGGGSRSKASDDDGKNNDEQDDDESSKPWSFGSQA